MVLIHITILATVQEELEKTEDIDKENNQQVKVQQEEWVAIFVLKDIIWDLLEFVQDNYLMLCNSLYLNTANSLALASIIMSTRLP